ncbi:MAG: SDR family NAD(P)-dependent oxidoreductase [Desulfosarcinaceae bacterium]
MQARWISGKTGDRYDKFKRQGGCDYRRSKTIEAFGKVDLLFNNAGVATGASIWESSINDCQWVIGVNLWGVIHCIHEFVSIVLKQGTSCRIVNTSSMAGFTTYPPVCTLSTHQAWYRGAVRAASS